MPTMNERWEQGIEHDPRSVEIGKAIADIDCDQGDDSLGWKFGGDGDNGEQLLYALDVYFERKDAENRIEPLCHADGSLEQFMPKVDGKPFRCECGCNVFHKPDKTDLELFKCNSCGEQYRGD